MTLEDQAQQLINKEFQEMQLKKIAESLKEKETRLARYKQEDKSRAEAREQDVKRYEELLNSRKNAKTMNDLAFPTFETSVARPY